MKDFLLGLAEVALGGSAAILLLLLAGRLLGSRYGARWRCWAWLLLCLRLAIPFPLLPEAPAPIQVTVPAVTLPSSGVAAPARPDPLPDEFPEPAPDFSDQAPAREEGDEGPAPAPADAAPAWSWETALFALWLAGAAGVLGWNLLAHGRFLRWLRRWAVPADDPAVIRTFHQLSDRLGLARRPRLLVCPGLRAPMVAGLIRPVLLLPREAPEGEALTCALLHELTHLRRRDIWRKALALWVTALYWFDPLVWLMGRAMERDGELACDEAALNRLPPEARAAYGRAVWEAVERVSRPD